MGWWWERTRRPIRWCDSWPVGWLGWLVHAAARYSTRRHQASACVADDAHTELRSVACPMPRQVADLVDKFYSLVTDLYEWGWGQSFHFSRKLPNRDWTASEVAHEAWAAATIRLG